MRNPVLFLLALLFMGSTVLTAGRPLGDEDTQQTPTQGNPDIIRVIHRVPPVYPAEAKAKRIGGTVTIEARVDKQGNVSSARVIEGDKIFFHAALASVMKWKFEPPKAQEQPVEIIKIAFNP